ARGEGSGFEQVPGEQKGRRSGERDDIDLGRPRQFPHYGHLSGGRDPDARSAAGPAASDQIQEIPVGGPPITPAVIIAVVSSASPVSSLRMVSRFMRRLPLVSPIQATKPGAPGQGCRRIAAKP